MTELESSLNELMANVFVMYFKTHSFHWNVEGVEFSQYHEFFGDLYEDIYNSVDPIAENLRKLNVYAPKSISAMYDNKTLLEETGIPDLRGMLSALLSANDQVLYSLNRVFALAQQQNKQGLCNFIADRIDTHEKHGWQLRASLKG
jgi:starvation-inducible DNA-binding protein